MIKTVRKVVANVLAVPSMALLGFVLTAVCVWFAAYMLILMHQHTAEYIEKEMEKL